MEPQLTPGAAITRAFASTQQQIQNAIDNLANQQSFITDIIEQHEQRVIAEYNEAIDIGENLNAAIDKKQGIIDTLRTEIHSLKESQGEFELRALNAEIALASTEKLRLAEKSRANEADRQLGALNALNPKRIQAQNKEKTKLLEKQRGIIVDMKSNELLLKRSVTELQTQNTSLLAQLDLADTEIKKLNLAHRLVGVHKQYLDRRFYNEDDVKKQRPFYAYLLTDGGNQSAASWLTGGGQLFSTPTGVYVKSNVKPDPNNGTVEILGSEFESAKSLMEKREAA